MYRVHLMYHSQTSLSDARKTFKWSKVTQQQKIIFASTKVFGAYIKPLPKKKNKLGEVAQCWNSVKIFSAPKKLHTK